VTIPKLKKCHSDTHDENKFIRKKFYEDLKWHCIRI
jgi:hypothetical protein